MNTIDPDNMETISIGKCFLSIISYKQYKELNGTYILMLHLGEYHIT